MNDLQYLCLPNVLMLFVKHDKMMLPILGSNPRMVQRLYFKKKISLSLTLTRLTTLLKPNWFSHSHSRVLKRNRSVWNTTVAHKNPRWKERNEMNLINPPETLKPLLLLCHHHPPSCNSHDFRRPSFHRSLSGLNDRFRGMKCIGRRVKRRSFLKNQRDQQKQPRRLLPLHSDATLSALVIIVAVV